MLSEIHKFLIAKQTLVLKVKPRMHFTPTDLQIELTPKEAPDWGYARNLRAFLRRPLAEWSSSLFSVPLLINSSYGLSRFVVPNRDFPYEGLLGMTDRENWKFLDSLPIGIYFENEWLNLEPSKIVVSPWKCSYEYTFNNHNSKGTMQVEYYLGSATNKCGLRVGVSIDLSEISDGHGFLVLNPLVDIRHMYSQSIPEEHEVSLRQLVGSSQMLQVSKNKKYLFLLSDSNKTFLIPQTRVLNWFYKLGNGERINTPEGIRFKGDKRSLLAPGIISTPLDFGKKEKINTYAFWSGTQLSSDQITCLLANNINDEHIELQNIERVLRSFKIATPDRRLNQAIAARIISLTKFGIILSDPKTNEADIFPDAGAWWFRAVWLRDVYEGLLNNLQTLLLTIGGKEFMKSIISSSIALLDFKFGGLPNKLPEYEEGYNSVDNSILSAKYYNSSDATLLFVIFACQFAHETKDRALGVKMMQVARELIDCYMAGDQNEVDGHPALSNDYGLLLSVPNHSWADSCVDVKINNLRIPSFPTRVPLNWMYSQNDADQIYRLVHSPRFLLPEINALWIEALKNLVQLLRNDLEGFISDVERLRLCKEFEIHLAKARASFKKVFWNESKGFLYSIVNADLSERDETESSFAVVSIALLNDLFSDDELKRFWNSTRNTLLVQRKPQIFGSKEMQPFGVLVKNSSNRIFFGDRQYHEAVIWPRDTVYLIRLLERLGYVNIIKEILINNIDHQMTEGALFYNSELFGLPEGNNPFESSTSCNPIPLKNPAQWWSHWTDLFLDFFERS